ncbi:restriction endonuclease subunit S [Flavonifractor plautii]|uniref:restriction endonuclease subunit S n=1 Tax=Flavonifractor plautii TaxID=292800 RepID=UPI001FAA3B26|nr:restriction endonuclease subunit S [Flavonifractor plautii]
MSKSLTGFGEFTEPDFYTHFPAMLPRSSRPRAAWGTGVYPSKQYFDIKMRCLRQRRHRRRWYLKGADNTPYEKIGDEVRSLADEVPFDIPDSWEWVRLGNISSYAETKQKVNATSADPSIWGLDLEDIEKGGRLLEYKTVGERKAVGDKTVFTKGDILYSKLRPYLLKILVAPDDGICTPEIVPFRVYGGIDPSYIVNYLKSPYVDNLINSITYGVKMPRVGTETMTSLLVPIPPLEEQRRIVEKIDEVASAVSAYDVTYQKSEALNSTFPEALKKSILQEAVQGKLVPQDPTDEPAEALLERIRAKKQQLIKEGKIKKDKHESVIFRRDNSHYEKLDGVERCIDDELPFEIPDSWVWVRLGTVLEIARGGSPRPIQQYLTTEPDGINWIKIGDTDKGGKYIYKTKEKIRPEGVTKSRMVHSGDFLLTNSMSFGRPYILKTDGCIHDGWLVLSNRFDCYSVDFIYYILSSPFAYYQFCDSVSGAVVKNLNSDKVANALFPLPPLAEQHRIVQRIEELLPLVKGL